MNKTAFIILLFLIITYPLISQERTLTLKGTAKGFKPDELSLIINDRHKNINIIDNKFDIKVVLDKSPQKIYLHKKNGGYFPFYAEDTIMKAQISSDDIYHKTKISGSITQDIYSLFLEAGVDTKKNIELFKKYLNTPPGIERLNYLAKELPIETVKNIYNSVNLKNINKVARTKAVINTYNIEKMEIGTKAYPFVAIDQYGDSIIFNNNKYILLSFSETYCPACRKIYKQLNNVQEKYKSSLKVINFHIDNNKEDWRNIINEENININFSSVWEIDNKLELLEIYDVYGWPLYYLINNKDIIIAKWFGNSKRELNRHLRKNIK